jgi:hypothetical protein
METNNPNVEAEQCFCLVCGCPTFEPVFVLFTLRDKMLIGAPVKVVPKMTDHFKCTNCGVEYGMTREDVEKAQENQFRDFLDKYNSMSEEEKEALPPQIKQQIPSIIQSINQDNSADTKTLENVVQFKPN